MKKWMMVAVAAVLLAADDPRKEDSAKQDLEKLQGNWTMASLEINGKLESEERIKDVTLVIKGDQYIVKTGGRTFTMTFTLDATKKPKAIDMVFAEGPEKDKVHRGIYAIDGDSFKLCRGRLPDKERPMDFGTWPDTDTFLAVWKRQK